MGHVVKAQHPPERYAALRTHDCRCLAASTNRQDWRQHANYTMLA